MQDGNISPLSADTPVAPVDSSERRTGPEAEVVSTHVLVAEEQVQSCASCPAAHRRRVRRRDAKHLTREAELGRTPCSPSATPPAAEAAVAESAASTRV